MGLALFFVGPNPKLKPGSLLAVPGNLATAVQARIRTTLGQKMLTVLTDYGGYIDDDTASNTAAYSVADGVAAEVDAAYGSVNNLAPGPGSDYYHDLVAVFQALHVVDNNGPARHGGGGVPRQPPALPICGME